MNTKVNKAYFLIPVFYVTVIIFLLYMQFSGSNSFNAEVAGISISGKTHSGAPGRKDSIPELDVVSNNLQFSFGDENPLLVFTQDGLTHRTEPIDYRVTASGIDIKLSKEIAVSFYYSQKNDNILHISIAAGDPESIKYIHLPISGKQTEITTMPEVPILSIKSETLGNFFLTMPESSTFIPESGAIVLYPQIGEASELALEQTAGSGLDAFTYWMSGNKKIITASELNTKLDRYIDKAAAALNGSRFNPTRGSWTSGSSISSFSEDALIMAATEEIGSSSYKRSKELLDRATLSHSRELSIRSSSLFGNIVNMGWAYEQKLEDKTKTLRRKAEASDYSVFEDIDIIPAVLTESSDRLIEALIRLSETANSAEINISQAAAILDFYSELNNQDPRLGSKFIQLTGVIERIILPSVKVLADKLFIVKNENTADIFISTKIGSLLMKLDDEKLHENYTSIGRELVNSILQLADESGFLPETAIESGNGELITDGVITPEKVYPMLTDNPYFPATDYFHEETDEKISVLNQAESFNIEKTDFGYRMAFDFPAGQTHTFAVRNIKPFYMMHLLGFRWNPDHRFLTYSSGWWYDKQHNTLFVKIKHRTTTEEILIYTERPLQPVDSAGSDIENTTADEE